WLDAGVHGAVSRPRDRTLLDPVGYGARRTGDPTHGEDPHTHSWMTSVAWLAATQSKLSFEEFPMFTQKFYVADTHFGHRGIIKSCNRPFATVEEMDRELVARWNAVVRPHDIVYHLGDFGWAADEEALRKLFGKLNGRKFLILGNHDLDKKTGECRSDLAALPWEAPPTHRMEVRDGGHRVILDHYAGRTWS